jgi:acetolactate synthase I/II/III large subunit
VTTADLVADSFVRARVRFLFAAMKEGRDRAVVDAADRHGLRVIATAGERAACLMAAVTGSLLDAPGCAVFEEIEDVREALRQALRDRSPVVLVSGCPLSGDVRDIVKAAVVVEAATAAHWSAHALQLAMTEPRGPVQLVVPPRTAVESAIPVATSVRPDQPGAPAAATLDLAAHLLGGAIRPLLVVGLECQSIEASAWVRALAEALPAPVLVTRKGKGALPDPHPLHLGLIDRAVANHPVLARADLVVMIGVDPSEVPADGWPSSVPVLYLGNVPWAAPTRASQLEVVGDISLAIAELAPRLRGRQRADWDVAEIDRLKRTTALLPARLFGARRLPGHTVVGVVRDATPPGTVAVIAAETDDPALLAAWQTVAPGELVTPAPPAASGFALPAAVGAGLARPGSRVACFASARQILDDRRELATPVRLGLPLLVVVVGETGEAAAAPEVLVRHAVAAGWAATVVSDMDNLRQVLEGALASTGSTLIDTRGASA